MKKEYVTPAIEIVDIENDNLLNAVSVETESGPGVGGGEAGDETPDLAKHHHDGWEEWD